MILKSLELKIDNLYKLVYNYSMKIDIQTNYPDPTQFNGFLLWQAANKLEKQTNIALKPYDLNHAEMLHLISIFHLLQFQNSLNQSQLSVFTGVTTMSVSKILTKLEKRKLITRTVGLDPRSKEISPTNSGIALLQTCAPIMNDVNNTFFPAKLRSQLLIQLSQL
jgi:DNA-binding MarR family transcriptional regulator